WVVARWRRRARRDRSASATADADRPETPAPPQWRRLRPEALESLGGDDATRCSRRCAQPPKTNSAHPPRENGRTHGRGAETRPARCLRRRARRASASAPGCTPPPGAAAPPVRNAALFGRLPRNLASHWTHPGVILFPGILRRRGSLVGTMKTLQTFGRM